MIDGENLDSTIMNVEHSGNPLLRCEVCDREYFLSDHDKQPPSYPPSYSPPPPGERRTPIPTTKKRKEFKNGQFLPSPIGAGHSGSIGEESVPNVLGILLPSSGTREEIDPEAETQRLVP
jgi:hypothetical protein